MAPKFTIRRSSKIPSAAYAVVEFISETLDCLNPWHHDIPFYGGHGDELDSFEPDDIFFDY